MALRYAPDDSQQVPDERSELLQTANPNLEDGTSIDDPLLGSYSTNETPEGASSNGTGERPSRTSKAYPYVVILALLFSIVADFGGSLVDTPEVRLLEMAVCRDYYRRHDLDIIGPPPLSYVPERDCKIQVVQRDLAYLRATKSILMTLPGELTSGCFSSVVC